MKTLLTLLAITATLTLNSTAEEPVNKECPVCHKDARLIFRSKTADGKRVIFCTAECKDKFDKTPAKFSVKPK